MSKIASNVIEFIKNCSVEIGKHSEADWEIELDSNCQELGMNSPIEQILYCAIKTVRKLNYISADEPSEDGKINYIMGLGIYPQKKIGNYRVDFLIGNYSYDRKNKTQLKKEVIVECDSQQFHERTEKERRYEKQRDRFLQSQGYKIFHYTGSEICQSPNEIAQEIIAFITERNKEDILIDSNLE